MNFFILFLHIIVKQTKFHSMKNVIRKIYIVKTTITMTFCLLRQLYNIVLIKIKKKSSQSFARMFAVDKKLNNGVILTLSVLFTIILFNFFDFDYLPILCLIYLEKAPFIRLGFFSFCKFLILFSRILYICEHEEAHYHQGFGQNA
jgi:hypothetical protein